MYQPFYRGFVQIILSNMVDSKSGCTNNTLYMIFHVHRFIENDAKIPYNPTYRNFSLIKGYFWEGRYFHKLKLMWDTSVFESFKTSLFLVVHALMLRRHSSRIGMTKSCWRSMYSWVSSAYVINLIPWALIASQWTEKSMNRRGHWQNIEGLPYTGCPRMISIVFQKNIKDISQLYIWSFYIQNNAGYMYYLF